MRSRRAWGLRYHLSAMLVATIALAFLGVGAALWFWRVPQMEQATLVDLQRDVADVSERLELLLGGRQARLELMASLLRSRPAHQAAAVLQANVHASQLFRAVYLVSPRGRVVAVALADGVQAQGDDFLGSDLSASALYGAVGPDRPVAWSGRLLSALSGGIVIGVAFRDADDHVLIGEIPIATLLRELQEVAGAQDTTIWVVDRSGEVVADTEGRQMGRLNLQNWPLMQAALAGSRGPARFEFERQLRQGAVALAPTLDWFIFGSVVRGWGDPQVRQGAHYTLAGFAGCMGIALLVAPGWASRLGRSLREIIDQAASTTGGRSLGRRWPRGPVAEFNRLSADLEGMAAALHEREHKLQALFNVAPVPMAVTDMDDGHCFLDVNAVWSEEVGYSRAEAVGLNSLELGLWQSPDGLAELLDSLETGTFSGEVEMVCKDGQVKLYKSLGRVLEFKSQRLTVWGSVNIGPLRRVEQELRTLNHDLEARVAQRAEALELANAELSETLDQLRLAQGELVRTEKMAALGGLVAGVAHELNTPLGNSVMAASAIEDATRALRSTLATGLRRSDLAQWIDGVEQGTDIAARNLGRAADLVQSFKQVAVDQTSAQRRNFELAEVVHEMVVSLKPSFARTAYRVEVQVPAGLHMDSYPGALGQALGNLIQNAVQHGFDGRSHGTVRITGGRRESGRLWLRVADDGHGIAPELLGRIFDPFMTTKMGQGGTGLGLHISYNAVVKLLGGSLSVESTPGQGSCFELRLPDSAPHAVPVPPGKRA